MKQYLGLKLIEATPMCEGLWQSKDQNCEWNGNRLREGYKVVYPDGYVSWSPKEVFEEAYREINNLTFGLAIEAMKKGLKVCRESWNDEGMFIFIRPGDSLQIDFVIDKVKSIPQCVKDYYLQDIVDKKGQRVPADEDDVIEFTPYICMKSANGKIINGWVASQTDILAEDWMIV